MALNRIIIMGRLVADPILKKTSNDISVTNMRIAVDRTPSRDNKEKVTDFFDVVAWRQTAEFASRYFLKGKPILIEGRLQSRKWQDKDGGNRVAIEIVADNIEFCGGDKVTQPQNTGYGPTPGYGQVSPDAKIEDFVPLPDGMDDLPFDMDL